MHNEKINETSVLAIKSDVSLRTPVHREVTAYSYIINQFYFTILPQSKSFYLYDSHIVSHELQELFSNH